MVFALQACGNNEDKDPYLNYSKQELVDLVRNYEQQLQTLNDTLTEKETLLQGIQSSTDPSTAISEMPDGTGRLTFNEFSDGTVVFPNPLVYPDAEVSSTQNRIYITNMFSVAPDSSWNCVLNGSTLELENNDLKIGAQITVGYRNGDYLTPEYLQSYMDSNFFMGWPPENITYQVLMADTIKAGVDAYTHTFIDSEDAWVRIGIGQVGTTTFTYSVCYKGDESSVANAAIKNLLQSIQVSGQPLQIEN